VHQFPKFSEGKLLVMPASRLHLVRHGEVFNPEGVLYERIDGFELSETGHRMATAAASELSASGRQVARLLASPLLRTQQSAAPIAQAFGLKIETEPRVIEPWNKFKGLKLGPKALLKRPSLALNLYNPSRPSWGEPFAQIANRMIDATLEAWQETPEGDVVIVSHQLPIWMLYRSSQGLRLPHDPRQRRCSLSSITSFEVIGGRLQEVSYSEPGLELAKNAVDGGAV
jgi:broad specificity phosphatase PhoE